MCVKLDGDSGACQSDVGESCEPARKVEASEPYNGEENGRFRYDCNCAVPLDAKKMSIYMCLQTANFPQILGQ
jgi:hypothetical protein